MSLNGYSFDHSDRSTSYWNFIAGLSSGVTDYTESIYSGIGGMYSLIPDGLIYLDKIKDLNKDSNDEDSELTSALNTLYDFLSIFMEYDPFGSETAYKNYLKKRKEISELPQYNKNGKVDWSQINADFNNEFSETPLTITDFKKKFNYKSVNNDYEFRKDLGIEKESGMPLLFLTIQNHAYFDFFSNMVEINQKQDRAAVLKQTLLEVSAKHHIDDVSFKVDLSNRITKNFNFFKEYILKRKLTLPYGKGNNFFKDYCCWKYSSTDSKTLDAIIAKSNPSRINSNLKDPNYPKNFYRNYVETFEKSRFESNPKNKSHRPQISNYRVLSYKFNSNCYNGPLLMKQVIDELYSNDLALNNPFTLRYNLLELSKGLRPVYLSYFTGDTFTKITNEDSFKEINSNSSDFCMCTLDDTTSFIVAQIYPLSTYLNVTHTLFTIDYNKAMQNKDDKPKSEEIKSLIQSSLNHSVNNTEKSSLFYIPKASNFTGSPEYKESFIKFEEELYKEPKFLAFTSKMPINANKYKLDINGQTFIFNANTNKIEDYDPEMKLCSQKIFYRECNIDFSEENKSFGIYSFEYKDIYPRLIYFGLYYGQDIVTFYNPEYTDTGFLDFTVHHTHSEIYPAPPEMYSAFLRAGGSDSLLELHAKNQFLADELPFNQIRLITSEFYKWNKHVENESELNKYKSVKGFDESLRNNSVDKYLREDASSSYSESYEEPTENRTFGGVTYNFFDPLCIKVLNQFSLNNYSKTFYNVTENKDKTKKSELFNSSENKEDTIRKDTNTKSSEVKRNLINKSRGGIDFRNKVFNDTIEIYTEDKPIKYNITYNHSLYYNSQYSTVKSSIFSYLPQIKNLIPTVSNEDSEYSMYYLDAVTLHNADYSCCEYWFKFFEREFAFSSQKTLGSDEKIDPESKNLFFNTKNFKLGISWKNVCKLKPNTINFEYLLPYLGINGEDSTEIIPDKVYETRFFILPAQSYNGKTPLRVFKDYTFNYKKKRYELDTDKVTTFDYMDSISETDINNHWILFIKVTSKREIEIIAVSELYFYNETAQYKLGSSMDTPWGVSAWGCQNLSWNSKSYMGAGWYPAVNDLIHTAIEHNPQDYLIQKLTEKYAKMLEKVGNKKEDIKEFLESITIEDYIKTLKDSSGYEFQKNLVRYEQHSKSTNYKYNHFWVRSRPCFALPLDPEVINRMTYQNRGNLLLNTGCIITNSIFYSSSSFLEDSAYRWGYDIGVVIRELIDYFTGGAASGIGVGTVITQSIKIVLKRLLKYYVNSAIDSYIITPIREYLLKKGYNPLAIGLAISAVQTSIALSKNIASSTLHLNLFKGKNFTTALVKSIKDEFSFSGIANDLNYGLQVFFNEYSNASTFFSNYQAFKFGIMNRSLDSLLNKENDRINSLIAELRGNSEEESFNLKPITETIFLKNSENSTDFGSFIVKYFSENKE